MMNELIKVNYEGDKALVSARELHGFLGLSKRFSVWMEQYIKEDNKYGFEENLDFTSVLTSTVVNNGAKRELQDYALTTDMAKEISMITGTEKGKQARKYFIQCEKKLKEITNKTMLPTDYISALKALIQAEEEKALMQPKVEYYEQVLQPNTYVKLLTSTVIAKDLGTSATKLHEKLNELGVMYKQNKTWVLYSKYQDRVPEYCDYTINEYGETLKWTEKGREWIIELCKDVDFNKKKKKKTE